MSWLVSNRNMRVLEFVIFLYLMLIIAEVIHTNFTLLILIIVFIQKAGALIWGTILFYYIGMLNSRKLGEERLFRRRHFFRGRRLFKGRRLFRVRRLIEKRYGACMPGTL